MLCDRDRDLLLYRYSNDALPFMVKGNFISEKTIGFVERYGLPSVDIRTMLDCQCKDGVCAKCHGLKFDSMELPRVGENICIEAAQAMGEPATQIKLSKFHGGGAAGAGASGVDDVKYALLYGKSGSEYNESSQENGRKADLAVQSWAKGYVYLKSHETLSSKTLVYVLSGEEFKQISLGGESEILDGKWNMAVNKAHLVVSQGQYVQKFDSLTDGYRLPTEDIYAIGREEFRVRQLQALDFYYNIYHENGVDVHARHFEVTAVLQTGLVFVDSSTNPEFTQGGIYEFKEVVGKDGVCYHHAVQNSSRVIGHYSGPATLLSYRDISKALSGIVTSCEKEKPDGTALLGKVVVGTDLVHGAVRKNPESNGIYVPQVVEIDYGADRKENQDVWALLSAAIAPTVEPSPDVVEDNLDELFAEVSGVPSEPSVPEEPKEGKEFGIRKSDGSGMVEKLDLGL